MAANLACDKFWVNKTMYHDAEKKYYENLTKLQRNRQSCADTLEDKNEEKNNRKLKEHKKLHLKNHKNVSYIDVDALKQELIDLEAKNAENENQMNQKNILEIIEKKKNFENDGVWGLEKKSNKKEGKERKSKNEKKTKKLKEKEDYMDGVGMSKLSKFSKSSLAGEVAKARQHIKSSLECMEQNIGGLSSARLEAILSKLEKSMESLTKRVEILEKKCSDCSSPKIAICPSKPSPKTQTPPAKPSKGDDDDVDLFASDEEEEDEEAKKIREQRLAEYAAKKSKKPALIAKSNIILDIKPWDDETDMKAMEKSVREIQMDGLVWGASKLVPVAFKIFKLQISCVIEDDKVSVDVLTETLESIEDYVSVKRLLARQCEELALTTLLLIWLGRQVSELERLILVYEDIPDVSSFITVEGIFSCQSQIGWIRMSSSPRDSRSNLVVRSKVVNISHENL